MPQPVPGLHHVTVIAGDPQRNLDFYTQVLGQRLVKTTVNFDDPGTYHLYYGDEVGSPGTILTFFPWANAQRGTLGNGETAAVAYGVGSDSVGYWKERLKGFDLGVAESERFDETVLSFADPNGLRLELITDSSADVPTYWKGGSVPREHALRGFHGVTLWLANRGETETVLTEQLGLEKVGEETDPEGERTRYQSASEGIGLYVDIVERPSKPPGRSGAGTVHHIALRVPDDEEQQAYLNFLREQGQLVTPVQDRQYFRSIYFREPGGVLLELATDIPGFPDDEPVETLGRDLKLPPWLEPKREQIEVRLPKLERPEGAA